MWTAAHLYGTLLTPSGCILPMHAIFKSPPQQILHKFQENKQTNKQKPTKKTNYILI